MLLEIKATNIIDNVIPRLDDIENFYKALRRYKPKGEVWVNSMPDDLKYKYHSKEKAEREIVAMADVLGVHWAVLYETVRPAREWYNRTNWQYCLSEETAEGLYNLAVTNNKK